MFTNIIMQTKIVYDRKPPPLRSIKISIGALEFSYTPYRNESGSVRPKIPKPLLRAQISALRPNQTTAMFCCTNCSTRQLDSQRHKTLAICPSYSDRSRSWVTLLHCVSSPCDTQRSRRQRPQRPETERRAGRKDCQLHHDEASGK